jgi:signal transduction histidine kinase
MDPFELPQADASIDVRERLDTALLAGEVGTFEWDVQSDRLWGDRSFARMFSITLDDKGAAPLSAYLAAIHPDDRDHVMQQIEQTLDSGRDYEAEYRIVTGPSPRWVVARGKIERDPAGGALRFPGVVIDVTARRMAEEALRASELKYRTLFERIDEGFCLLQLVFEDGRATDYRFIDMNPAFEMHTGLSSARGRMAREVLPDLEEHWFEIYGRVAMTGEPTRFQSGSDVMGRWFDVFAFRIGDAADRMVALLFKEVTAQWQAQQELVRAKEAAEQASLAKSQFLAVMSHELRTPLSGVIGFADLVDSAVLGPVTAKQREAMARIKASSWHLVGIIDDILTLSRAEAGKEEIRDEAVDLSAAVREVVRVFEPQAAASGHELHIIVAGDGLRTRTDAGKLRQILFNLVGNAVKYSVPGRIDMRVDATSSDDLFVHVVDEGPGIMEEDRERIFEPFTQADSSLTRSGSGVGLGLAICRRLARLLGGDVLLVSEPGEGSTFTLRLPRS